MNIRRTPLRLLRRVALVAVIAAMAVVLTGCGLQPATAFTPAVSPGSIQHIKNLPAGASITVTSKNFTEQIVVGKMAILGAKAAGFEVTDLTNVPGSSPTRNLMLKGGSDMTWDYTGTAWLTYLGHEVGIPDQDQQYVAVRNEDLKNGLTWLKPAELNDTYALAARSSAVAALGGITSLSQIQKLPVSERTFCVESEFYSRPDGLKPMLQKYGLVLGSPDGVPNRNVKVLDTGAVYEATSRGACNFGEVFTTDGRINALHLKVLVDDEEFFPSYNIAPVVRTATLKKYPQLKKVFDQIAAKLTNAAAVDFNYQVDVLGKEPGQVAFDWMEKQGLVTSPDQTSG